MFTFQASLLRFRDISPDVRNPKEQTPEELEVMRRTNKKLLRAQKKAEKLAGMKREDTGEELAFELASAWWRVQVGVPPIHVSLRLPTCLMPPCMPTCCPRCSTGQRVDPVRGTPA